VVVFLFYFKNKNTIPDTELTAFSPRIVSRLH